MLNKNMHLWSYKQFALCLAATSAVLHHNIEVLGPYWSIPFTKKQRLTKAPCHVSDVCVLFKLSKLVR